MVGLAYARGDSALLRNLVCARALRQGLAGCDYARRRHRFSRRMGLVRRCGAARLSECVSAPWTRKGSAKRWGGLIGDVLPPRPFGAPLLKEEGIITHAARRVARRLRARRRDA